MTVEEVRSFINVVNNYNNIEYLLSTIMYSAAATLAREKVSSLINFSNNHNNMKKIWVAYKKYIKNIINIDFIELKSDENNIVVLFYCREELEKILKDKKNMDFLVGFGYSEKMSIEESILYLSKRFKKTCPHEIGIFLGYPLEDVICFMKHPNDKCMMIGYWKVYNNVEYAKIIFDKYDKIKQNVIRMMIYGINPIDVITLISFL